MNVPLSIAFRQTGLFLRMKGSFVRQKRWDCLTLGVTFFFFCVCACACKKRIMFVSLRERKCARLWGRDCVCVLTDLFKQRVCLCKKNKCLVILSAFQSDISKQWVCIHVNKAACFSAVTSAALSQDGNTAAQTCCSFLYSIVSDGEWNRLCLFLLFLRFKASAVMHQTFFFISTATKITKL